MITRIVARGVYHRASAVGWGARYALANLFVTFGNDEELHRAFAHVHHLVEHKRHHDKSHIAIDNLLPTLQNQVAKAYDYHVYQQDNAPKRNVAVFVDDGRNDVRPTRTAMIRQSKAQTDTAETRPDDAGHEGFVAKDSGIGEELAEQPNEHRHHRHTVDGFQAKLKAQNFQGNGKKYQVHAKVCELHRGVRTPKDDGRKTGYTT